MQCPQCHGEKVIIGLFPIWSQDMPIEKRLPVIELPCFLCDGKGEVPEEMAEWIRHGAKIRQHRVAAGFGLRQAAELIGILPSWICDVESGRVYNRQFSIGETTPGVKP